LPQAENLLPRWDDIVQGPGPETAKLRAFCISQVCVPWTFIPGGQLLITQLKIILLDEMSTADAPLLGNARQFIDLLVDCPALEILVLELCLPRDLSQSSQGRTVELARLSRLCVGGSSSRVTNLLKMLRLPSTTTYHLRGCAATRGYTHNPWYPLYTPTRMDGYGYGYGLRYPGVYPCHSLPVIDATNP